jgi:hypothetical protein
MTNFSDVVGRLLRGLLKLALLALTLLFLLGLLLIGLVAAVFILLWSLLTGRKPALWTAFSLFRQASHQFRPQASADVVDVQAHEVGGQPPPSQGPVPPPLRLTDEVSGAEKPPKNPVP